MDAASTAPAASSVARRAAVIAPNMLGIGTGSNAATAAASYMHGRPSAVTHHHGSPTWNLGASPAAAPIATNARAPACRYAIASPFAGDSKVDGGTHPVSAGNPSA